MAMVHQLQNPWRGRGSAKAGVRPLVDASAVARLLTKCPAHVPTPLHDVPELAQALGVASLSLNDERKRMGLGSFKAPGLAHAIARGVAAVGGDDLWSALQGRASAATDSP